MKSQFDLIKIKVAFFTEYTVYWWKMSLAISGRYWLQFSVVEGYGDSFHLFYNL